MSRELLQAMRYYSFLRGESLEVQINHNGVPVLAFRHGRLEWVNREAL